MASKKAKVRMAATEAAAFSGLALLPAPLHADEQPESERQTKI